MIHSTASVRTSAATESEAHERAAALFVDYFGSPDFVITDLEANAVMLASGDVVTWEIRATAELADTNGDQS